MKIYGLTPKLKMGNSEIINIEACTVNPTYQMHYL